DAGLGVGARDGDVDGAVLPAGRGRGGVGRRRAVDLDRVRHLVAVARGVHDGGVEGVGARAADGRDVARGEGAGVAVAPLVGDRGERVGAGDGEVVGPADPAGERGAGVGRDPVVDLDRV